MTALSITEWGPNGQNNRYMLSGRRGLTSYHDSSKTLFIKMSMGLLLTCDSCLMYRLIKDYLFQIQEYPLCTKKKFLSLKLNVYYYDLLKKDKKK